MSNVQPVRQRIESLLAGNRVVLFMKGTREAPSCGFSAATTGALNDLLDDYVTVDVLADEEIRQGIKEYGNWPTIPQLYVDGELIGGADIVQGMAASGELHSLLGLAQPDRTPPQITISDEAAAQIRNALNDAQGMGLFLAIDGRFQPQFQLREVQGNEIRARASGIRPAPSAPVVPTSAGPKRHRARACRLICRRHRRRCMTLTCTPSSACSTKRRLR
jgi:monothiol glutaredoxin